MVQTVKDKNINSNIPAMLTSFSFDKYLEKKRNLRNCYFVTINTNHSPFKFFTAGSYSPVVIRFKVEVSTQATQCVHEGCREDDVKLFLSVPIQLESPTCLQNLRTKTDFENSNTTKRNLWDFEKKPTLWESTNKASWKGNTNVRQRKKRECGNWDNVRTEKQCGVGVWGQDTTQKYFYFPELWWF